MPEGHVTVKIRGTQISPDGGSSRTETAAEGILREKAGKHYLFFEEKAEDGSVTKSVVKYNKDILQLTRSGPVTSSIRFAENEHFRSSITVPYGSLLIDIDTSRYVMDEREDMTRLTVDYRLAVEGEHTARCLVDMEIRPQHHQDM